MNKNSKILVTGHNGMVGSGIIRRLRVEGYCNIIVQSRKELDLTRQEDVEAYFAKEKPEYVFHAAAKVGGIGANSEEMADFLYENIIMEMNVIYSAFKNSCKKLEFLGSSAIYPKCAPQPIKESCLLTSELDKANEGYALAKIAGIKYCEFLNTQYGTRYISLAIPNLYGTNDNYHPTKSHVIPAFIRRFHEAKTNNINTVTCWGDGSSIREFMHVDDLARVCVFLMNNYSDNEIINVGAGNEITIKEIAELVAKVVGYKGKIEWDISKPNGFSRKLMDNSKVKSLGFNPEIDLETGLKMAYDDFLNNVMRTER